MVSYLNGHEGASLTQCVFALYSLIHAAIKRRADVLLLLQHTRVSFACLMNPDALQEVEQHFKAAADGLVLHRVKNGRDLADCPPGYKGVNLKLNFSPDDPKNACTQAFRGPAARSEKELEGLSGYLAGQDGQLSSVLLLSK